MNGDKSEQLLHKALRVQQENVALFPDDVVSRNGLAETYKQLGRLDEAVHCYQETITCFPHEGVARTGLAEAFKALGRLDDALQLYSETIERFPENVIARTGRAETLRMTGRFDEALQSLDAIIQSHPENVVAKTIRADTLLRLGHADDAISAYEQVVHEFPANPVARNGLAEALRQAAVTRESANGTHATPHFRYQIALSFAGEDRQIASNVADRLIERGLSVFYDKYEQADLWGKDLFQHLATVYSEQAQYCIVFISDAYASRLWTKHEFKQAQARAFRDNREYILPVRLDDTEMPGLSDTIGYIDLRHDSVDTLINLILKKLSAEPRPER